MKVLHLSSEKTWRGGEQQIAYLIRGLEELGVQNYVACRKHSAFEFYCQNNHIDHIALPFANEFDLNTAWQVRTFCNDFEVDIVHMHSGHSHAIGVWSSVFGNKAKLILSRRVDFPIKNNLFSKFKYNYSKICKIICVSEAIKNVLSKDLKKPNKCSVVYSGIDLEKFKNHSNKVGKLRNEFNIDEKTTIVANISAIADHKDYPTFVATAEKVLNENNNCIFFIIGDGPLSHQIRELVQEKGLERKILFTGFRTDIPEIINDIDLLLITSKTEGLGTTILDFFANRIPVVATAGGGISELVFHEDTGMLSEVGDALGLSVNVLKILNSIELRTKLTENAFQLLQNNFNCKITAKKTYDIYRICSTNF